MGVSPGEYLGKNSCYTEGNDNATAKEQGKFKLGYRKDTSIEGKAMNYVSERENIGLGYLHGEFDAHHSNVITDNVGV